MSNVIKFQAPFERLKLYDSSPYVSIHKAIITQAIIDATNISECREAKKLEREAKDWIFGGSEYFKEICIGANIEPSFVVRITKAVIKLHRKNSKVRTKIVEQRNFIMSATPMENTSKILTPETI